jgi:hypothetical protein
MAIAKKVLWDGNRKATVKANSLGTAATTEVLVDLSALTAGETAHHFTIEEVWYSIQGFEYINVLFDATTDVQALVLSGDGYMDFRPEGGLEDPYGTGATGDILITTPAAGVADTFEIKMTVRKKLTA